MAPRWRSSGHLAAREVDQAEADATRALELAVEAFLDQAQDIADELGLMVLIERCRALARSPA